MSELWEQLQGFGFTQYEARTYIGLISIGAATAYQISKVSGVPRARVYETLDNLVQRGVAMVEEDEEGNKNYLPLPVDVFLDHAKQQWEQSFNHMEKELKRLETREPKKDIYVATVRGEENILSFCRILLRRAKRQVMLSMWHPMYEQLLGELNELNKSECRLKGIVFGVDSPIGDLYPHRMNTYMSSITDERWFILSVDNKELLYGHSAEKNGNAFYTDDPVHLYLLEDYIWHDVLVNQIAEKGNQEQLDNWILPELDRFFGRRQ